MTDPATTAVDPRDENLPFLSNFQDIFLTIGVIIFLSGAGIFSGMVGGGLADTVGPLGTALIVSGSFVVIAWGLSELLVRARRRILPGIVLSLVYLVAAMGIVFAAYDQFVDLDALNDIDIGGITDRVAEGPVEVSHGLLRAAASDAMNALPWSLRSFLIIMPLAGMVLAWVYYARFRLPFASALVGAGIVATVLAVLFQLIPYDLFRFSPTVTFLSGLALIFGAISYDMRDPERVTRFSGNGFWLHFIGAPLTLSGALSLVSDGFAYDTVALVEGDFSSVVSDFSFMQSVITLVVIAVFAVISLLLNRRALVVAGLISAGVAIAIIVRATGIGAAGVAAATLMLLGAGILLLGVGWNGARSALLSMVPAEGVFARIFPRNHVDG